MYLCLCHLCLWVSVCLCLHGSLPVSPCGVLTRTPHRPGISSGLSLPLRLGPIPKPGPGCCASGLDVGPGFPVTQARTRARDWEPGGAPGRSAGGGPGSAGPRGPRRGRGQRPGEGRQGRVAAQGGEGSPRRPLTRGWGGVWEAEARGRGGPHLLGGRRPLPVPAAPSGAPAPPRRPRPRRGPAPPRPAGRFPPPGPPLLVQAPAFKGLGLLTQPLRLSSGPASPALVGPRKGPDQGWGPRQP